MFGPSRQLLLLLCVGALALAGGAVVAADTDDRPTIPSETHSPTEASSVMINADNSSNYVSPDTENVTRTEYQSASLDVAGAVEGETLRLQGAYQERVLDEHLKEGDVDAIAADTVGTIERDAAALERQQRQLFQSYSEGELAASTLFRELVVLGVASDQYSDLADATQDRVDTTGAVDERYQNLGGEPVLLPSPFVSHVESELSTGGESPVYVQGGNDSLVLATVEGSTYLRQAVLFGEWDPDGPDTLATDDRSGAEGAFERAGELYPWTLENAESSESRGFGNTSVYRVQASHPQGQLQTYLDGATTNPFYEIQEKNPVVVPVTGFSQTFDDGLRLDVGVTSPTGPMEVEVRETTDVEYDNITVSIDGETVATLPEGGSFYTVQPRGAFEISAQTDTGREVSLFLSPS